MLSTRKLLICKLLLQSLIGRRGLIGTPIRPILRQFVLHAGRRIPRAGTCLIAELTHESLRIQRLVSLIAATAIPAG